MKDIIEIPNKTNMQNIQGQNMTKWEKLKKGANKAWDSTPNQLFIYPGMQLLVGLGLIASAGLIAWERLNPDTNLVNTDEYAYLGSNDPVVATLVALAGVMLVVAAAAHWAKLHASNKISRTEGKIDSDVDPYYVIKANHRAFVENRMMLFTGGAFLALGAFGLMLAMIDHTADTAGMTRTDSSLSFRDLSDSQEVIFLVTFASILAVGALMMYMNARPSKPPMHNNNTGGNKPLLHSNQSSEGYSQQPSQGTFADMNTGNKGPSISPTGSNEGY